MLTVRFPDGTAVEYNSAVKLVADANMIYLYNERDQWVASIPKSGSVLISASSFSSKEKSC